MQKFILKSILGFFIFLICNFIYLETVKRFDWNFKKQLEFVNLQNRSYECLIIGNSKAMDGIDSEFLGSQGMRSYNSAVGGASLKTNYIQLNRYLNEANEIPKYVILGLDVFRENWNTEELHPVVDFTENSLKFSYKELPLVKFKWMAIELLKKIISSDHRNARIVFGQLKIEKSIPDKTKVNLEHNKILNREKYLSATYIEKIYHLCLSNNIELIGLEMPAQRKYQNSIPIGPHKISFNGKDSFLLYNYKELEFSKLFNDQKDWLAKSHLNKYGAQKFTQVLYSTLFKED